MTQLATTNQSERIMEVLVAGNLGVLTAPERLDYYNRVCESLQLNPLTQPFAFITLNGKLTLYALKGATDQLRAIHNISISEPHITKEGDLYVVTVSGTDKSGRMDSDMGVVAIGGLKGEALANAMLKAITKAKRRLTLSMCGLGMLDETEIEDIPASSKRPPVVMPQARVSAPVDVETGEIGNSAVEAFWEATEALGYTKADVVAFCAGDVTEEQIEGWGAADLDACLSDLRKAKGVQGALV